MNDSMSPRMSNGRFVQRNATMSTLMTVSDSCIGITMRRGSPMVSIDVSSAATYYSTCTSSTSVRILGLMLFDYFGSECSNSGLVILTRQGRSSLLVCMYDPRGGRPNICLERVQQR